MKKIGLVLLGVFLYSFGFAQANDELTILQSLFGMEKKAIVAEFVQLDNTQQQAFWTLYEEYEVERKELGVSRLDLIVQYAGQYESMTDEQAAEFMSQLIDQRKKTDKVLDTYYKKISKATSPMIGLQFFQVESYILTAVRMYILDQVPFVSKQ
jgi:hypothetical protein